MSPIKPPDGRIPGAASTPAAPDDAAGVQRTGGSFKAAIERAQRSAAAAGAAQTEGVQQAVAAGGADPIAELARAVRAGAISKEQALDQLIERAAGGVQHALSSGQRTELLAVLRSALETDPALTALREALE